MFLRLREKIAAFFRFLGCLAQILIGFVVFGIVSAFGFWGWATLFVLLCIPLFSTDEPQKNETTSSSRVHTGGFPLPTKGYDGLLRDAGNQYPIANKEYPITK